MYINPEQDLEPIEVKLVEISNGCFKIVSIADNKVLGEAEEGLKGRAALEKLLKKNLNFVVKPN